VDEEIYPERKFVAIWADETGQAAGRGHQVTLMTEREVSTMLDMADCDAADGLVELLAVGKDGKLHVVTSGPTERVDTETPAPYYASAPLTTDDGLVVGRVHYTDH
jgi:hypothetical protein